MKRFQSLYLILLGAASLMLAKQASATITCNPWVAKMVSVQGTVEVNRAGQTQWLKAEINDTYCAGDRIQVGERSRADLALVNRPTIRLEQNTTLTLAGVRDERRSIIQLARGALYFFSRLPQNLEVITAFVNAGVEGTEGLVKVDADSTLITIFEGRVVASNPSGSLILTAGQSAIARQGSAPVLTTIVRPRDAVQWALYYPPVFDFKPEHFPNTTWQASASKSIAAYKQGDFTGAFESLRAVPDTIADSSFFTYRAALLLAVGRNDEASRDIQRALSLRASDSAALALQAVIAVAQNEKEKAIESAQKAVTADPKSSSALIALAYAQQANFNLEGARNSLKQAVEVNTNDALAWARLAELHLSFADLDDALAAAKRATAVDPNLSRTQTVLGFAYLTRVNTRESKKAFERAIELDQADPLPRLGLGLAKIREGDLADGREEIDIAVSLDPDNSLVRSYLGKAYFEEKLDQQASVQYNLAKSLDPNDPTPYFYDAILKETQNRPVEALRNLEKSIERNNNRTIYRSRFLLDQDLAARSANIGRIYRDLGFEKLALVEGWKSIITSPSDYSGHRLLADTYLALPRHDIARDSELLVSQLLQPININPVQPRLLGDGFLFLDDLKPSSLSFNEYSGLFEGNQLRVSADGIAGNRKTFGDNVIVSGLYNNLSFSLGQFHFQTDGFRKNNETKQNIYNVFAQAQLNHQSSVQTEFRRTYLREGDRFLLFDRQNFFDKYEERFDTRSIRVGFRHTITPSQTIVGSYFYRDFVNDVNNDPLQIFNKERAHFSEFRYFYQDTDNRIDFTTGIGNFFGRTREKILFNLLPDSFSDTPLTHHNLYFYTNVRPLRSLTVTLGISGDILRTNVVDRSQPNPKIGFLWNFDTEYRGAKFNTVFRGAAFRTVKRLVVSNQTIEPSHVAGFNQFFDDINGTRTWRVGVGLDQKITLGRPVFGLSEDSRQLYVGAEFSKREMSVPKILTQSAGEVIDELENERIARAYLYWTPFASLATTVEYSFEQLGRDPEARNAEALVKSNTHRVPLSIRFFGSSGLFGIGRATYVQQSGRFLFLSGDIQPGRDRFWVFDGSFGYRLPNRWGTLSLDLRNVFNSKFKFQDIDPRNSVISPGRVILFRVGLSIDGLFLR